MATFVACDSDGRVKPDVLSFRATVVRNDAKIVGLPPGIDFPDAYGNRANPLEAFRAGQREFDVPTEAALFERHQISMIPGNE